MELMGSDPAMWSFPVNASTSLHAAHDDPVLISWPFMVDSVKERRYCSTLSGAGFILRTRRNAYDAMLLALRDNYNHRHPLFWN